MSDQTVNMNELTSEDWDKVPFPARQQMGDQGGLKDARSGNGVHDQLGNPPESGGHTLQEVTYPLEMTAPPVEPPNAPGTREDGVIQGGTNIATGAAPDQSVVDELLANAHGEPGPVRSLPNAPAETTSTASDQSVAIGTKQPDALGAPGASEGNEAARATWPSESNESSDTSGSSEGNKVSSEPQASDVPTGPVQEVLDWVGDDSARARVAIEAEQRRASTRDSLMNPLNAKV